MDEIFEMYPALARVEKIQDGFRQDIRSYVLRGQRLKDYQIRAIKEHFEDYALIYDGKPFDFEKIFGNKNPVVIEIGFGMGDSTARIAKANPNINYIGIEVFLYGFSKLLAKIDNLGLTNLKIMRFDAVQVLEDLVPDASISGFHIFFPDPWPKKRHNRRRLVKRPFTDLLVKKLKKGGYVYCVTDWEDYASWMLEELGNTSGLKNPYNGYAPAREWRPETSFEKKGLEKDYVINEVWFEKE